MRLLVYIGDLNVSVWFGAVNDILVDIPVGTFFINRHEQDILPSERYIKIQSTRPVCPGVIGGMKENSTCSFVADDSWTVTELTSWSKICVTRQTVTRARSELPVLVVWRGASLQIIYSKPLTKVGKQIIVSRGVANVFSQEPFTSLGGMFQTNQFIYQKRRWLHLLPKPQLWGSTLAGHLKLQSTKNELNAAYEPSQSNKSQMRAMKTLESMTNMAWNRPGATVKVADAYVHSNDDFIKLWSEIKSMLDRHRAWKILEKSSNRPFPGRRKANSFCAVTSASQSTKAWDIRDRQNVAEKIIRPAQTDRAAPLTVASKTDGLK